MYSTSVTIEGEPRSIDIYPTWPIKGPSKRRFYLFPYQPTIAQIALRKEAGTFLLGPLLAAYDHARNCFEHNQVPTITEQQLSPRMPLTGDHSEDQGPQDHLINEIFPGPMYDALVELHGGSSLSELNPRYRGLTPFAVESLISRKIGPKIMRQIIKNHPALKKDPILRWSLDEALLRTNDDVNLLVEGRQCYDISNYDDRLKPARETISRILGGVARAMVDTMTDMHFHFDHYTQGSPERDPRSISTDAKRELYFDRLQRRYGN